MNIVLIGLMGTGKTTVGQYLARRMGRPFVDTDDWIVRRAGRSIAEIFAAEGEAGFRAREAAVIAEVAARDGLVIATGGGAVLLPENRAALRQKGLVIWLDAPPEEVYARTIHSAGTHRPLLAAPDPLRRLQELARERAPLYAATAHHRIWVADKSPAMVVDDIYALYAALQTS
jgi:shikimate kinase